MIENLNKQEILSVLKRNYIGRIGCYFEDTPHIIPITYAFDLESGHIISHTREGFKSKIFRENPIVCLQVEELENLNNWKSIIIYGEFEELYGVTARKALHIFVKNIRPLVNTNDSQNVAFVSDISHSTHPDNQAKSYRIKPYRMAGKYEKEYNDVMSN